MLWSSVIRRVLSCPSAKHQGRGPQRDQGQCNGNDVEQAPGRYTAGDPSWLLSSEQRACVRGWL